MADFIKPPRTSVLRRPLFRKQPPLKGEKPAATRAPIDKTAHAGLAVAVVAAPAEPASVLTRLSMSETNTMVEVPFKPYRRTVGRAAIYYTMAPLMLLAKYALTNMLRAMGGKLDIHATQHGHVAIWNMRGKNEGGPVSVLVHGLGGSSAEYFPAVAELKARCSRVICIDLPGHGHSSPIGRGTAAQFTKTHQADQRMVAAVAQAVQHHLGDTPARFIGHSLGGYIAARLVHERKSRGLQDKLLLTETDGAPWSAERLVEDRTTFSVPDGASARRVARGNYPLRPVLGWLYTPFLWARLASPEIEYLTHSDLKQPELTPKVLKSLPADTMVIAGRHDKFGTEKDVNYLMEHLPAGARLRRPETGHGDIADAHPEICTIFDEFLGNAKQPANDTH